MFTGIIYNTGLIKTIKRSKKSYLISIYSNIKFSKKDIGSSVCCNGVCLTLTKIRNKVSFYYLSKETLNKSNFKNIKINSIINMEKSLVYGQQISGHYVQGHVDTVGKIKSVVKIEKTSIIKILISNKYKKFLVNKASISINGVSLTIAEIKDNYLHLWIIPHTLKLTNLYKVKINDIVNLEFDIFSKYISKLKN
jgi:riboflavin synthase